MRPYSTQEKAKILAGAVASLVIVGWLVVLATAFLDYPHDRQRPPTGAAFVVFTFALPGPFRRYRTTPAADSSVSGI